MSQCFTPEQEVRIRQLVAELIDSAMVDAGRNIAMVMRGNVTRVDVRFEPVILGADDQGFAVHGAVSPTAGVATS